jgi:hypothetical protein
VKSFFHLANAKSATKELISWLRQMIINLDNVWNARLLKKQFVMVGHRSTHNPGIGGCLI